MWVLGRPPATEPGLVVSVMVASASAAVDAIRRAGGEIVRSVDDDARRSSHGFVIRRGTSWAFASSPD